MNESVEERAVRLGEYIAETGATVRAAAIKFCTSKSTVHKDVTQRLKTINIDLYREVKAVLQQNKAERHIRGGLSTKHRYEEGLIRKQIRNKNAECRNNKTNFK